MLQNKYIYIDIIFHRYSRIYMRLDCVEPPPFILDVATIFFYFIRVPTTHVYSRKTQNHGQSFRTQNIRNWDFGFSDVFAGVQRANFDDRTPMCENHMFRHDLKQVLYNNDS